jgi:Short repeat of unknown function (DUF308)
MPQSSGVLGKRVVGTLLTALGAFALAAPMAAGRWSLAILGIPLIVLSVAEAYAAFTSPRRADASTYLPCLLALIAGNLLLLSSALVVSGLLILLIAILLIDGFGKMLTVWREPMAHAFPRSSTGSSISDARRFFGTSTGSSAQSGLLASSSAPISQQQGGGC